MLIIVRIVVLLLLLTGTLVFGILPICIRPYLNSCRCSAIHQKGCATRKQRIATCFLIFFGGGVLLATCLVHLLHEARQGFEEALAKCADFENSTYSTEGFNHTSNIDVIFYDPLEDSNEKVSIGPIEEQNSFTYSAVHPTENSLIRNISRPFQSVLEKEPVYDNLLCSNEIFKTLFPLPEFITVCGFFLIYFVEELIKSIISCCHSANIYPSHSADISNDIEMHGKEYLSQGKIRRLTEHDDINHQSKNDGACSPGGNNVNLTANDDNIQTSFTLTEDIKSQKRKSVNNLHFFFGQSEMEELNVEGLDDFVTVLALSFNSVFEGFAAGFQHTEISTWMLFVSLALHNFVSAFVVSLETLYSGGSNLKVSLYMILFSLMCPLGMLAAIVTHRNLVESASLQICVLNALSVGTLLYVTFYEMLRQRKDFAEISGFSQFFVLLLGFAAMSSVEYIYTRVE